MGFTPAFSAALIEFDCAEHVAVIGHGHGRHAVIGHLFHEIRNPDGAVQEGVFSMKMQVDKGVSRHRHSTYPLQPLASTANGSQICGEE